MQSGRPYASDSSGSIAATQEELSPSSALTPTTCMPTTSAVASWAALLLRVANGRRPDLFSSELLSPEVTLSDRPAGLRSMLALVDCTPDEWLRRVFRTCPGILREELGRAWRYEMEPLHDKILRDVVSFCVFALTSALASTLQTPQPVCKVLTSETLARMAGVKAQVLRGMLLELWAAVQPFPPDTRMELALLERLMDRNGSWWQARALVSRFRRSHCIV